MAAYDVLSTTEARQILGVGSSDTSKDTIITRLVTTASRRLDEAIGPVIQRSVTAEEHDGGGCTIELQWGPVSAISSVTEYQGETALVITADTPGASATDGYLAERYKPDRSLLSGMLIRRISGYDSGWYAGRGNITVSYLAGRVASETQVEPRHKEAAGLILRNLWRPYENSVGSTGDYDVPVSSMPTFALPRAVVDLLAEEMQSPVGFG